MANAVQPAGGAVMAGPDPGPWRQEPGTPLVYALDGSLVANCTKTTNVCLANARLIAAAPQMLEALKRLLSEVEEILAPLDAGHSSADLLKDQPAIKIARAAIATAEAGDD